MFSTIGSVRVSSLVIDFVFSVRENFELNRLDANHSRFI
ncbi:hypothetical protein GXM_02649 [Nostoc sphaeroides CCNUC1]|uniref:Uncharacterized protein n=1 Tax=Nostoc sphaeroides CCNUC1 TaxID=2653204 RepID=A0A5P8VXN5_9NOSO|nr:hypothetical protein GXM_02649 [Nostoc sphaeroides CCNUC1]